jgi:hypothetical protein
VTIYECIQGDEIVRVQPSKPLNSGIRDRSYMGKKLIFGGIANGNIYFKDPDELSQQIFGDKLFSISLDLWDEGWEYYIDPKSLIIRDFKFR